MTRWLLELAGVMAALGLLSACAGSAVPNPAPIPVLLISTATADLNSTSPPTSVPFKGPLSVMIIRPGDGEVVRRSPVEIEGTADPETVITMNDQVLLIDDSGSFSLLMALEEGTNLVEITASDKQGNQDFAYLSILYEPAQ